MDKIIFPRWNQQLPVLVEQIGLQRIVYRSNGIKDDRAIPR